MLKKFFRTKLILFGSFAVFFLFFFFADLVFASEMDGTIDGTFKYAWGENIGWINFACEKCNVRITDSGISGYAWSKKYGWINLNPTRSGIINTAEGVLSGYAWSERYGWINFDGVTINSSGEFLGYATVKSDSSQINFNCVNAGSCSGENFKVKTDWRPASVRRSGSGGSMPHPLKTSPITPPVTPPTTPLILPSTTPPIIIPPITNPILKAMDDAGATLNSFVDSALSFFKPKKEPREMPALVEIPKVAPPAFGAVWGLLPAESIRSFVFAPLPYEVRVLATKFPELKRTLESVGIERLTDMSKLTGVTLGLPGLTELTNTLKDVGAERLADLNKINSVALNVPGLSSVNEQIINNVGTGRIALVKGLPLTKFTLIAKRNLPAEFVFARAAHELVDLNVAMSINEKGKVTQKISSLPGQTVRLVVKPISSARSVTGYFVFKGATPRITQADSQIEISRSSLTASALFSMNDLVEQVPSNSTYPPTPFPRKGEDSKADLPLGVGGVENKLMLFSFEYTDPDRDGIYTADVVTPTVPGEYEVITIIDYVDPVLGSRRMSMITVIDPEGYIFEKNNGKETRIPSAIVSLYSLNIATKKYELWGAKEYSQENPQVTDIRGAYSFLVPEGSYYFEVEAPGYDAYKGKVFVVREGSGIHQNIELKSGRGFLSNLDWKTVLLVVVFLLLLYNLYRNRMRDKFLKFSNKNDGK